MKRIDTQQTVVAKIIDDLSESSAEVRRLINDAWSRSSIIRNSINEQIISINEEIIKIRDDHLEKVSQILGLLKNIPEENSNAVNILLMKVKKVPINLAQQGWFLPDTEEVGSSFILDLIDLLEHGDRDSLNDIMLSFIEENMADFCDRLTEMYPHRKEFITQAYSAHISKNFIFSVPIFLMQADGIWIELSKHKSIYTKKHNKPRSLQFIDNISIKESLSYLFEPLRTTIPLIESCGERPPEELNRHAVIHGLSNTYDTKINSLKAFSWLCYVGTLFDSIDA